MEESSSPNFLRDRRTLVFLCLLFVCFAIIHHSFRKIGFVILADEGCYLKYGTYIADNGIKGFKKLFALYTTDKNNFFPNPLRAGFIILSSIWLKAFGYSFLGLAYLSLFSYLVFLCICYYFASKYFDKDLAILFVILLAFSPLNMAMARRAMAESTLNLFTAISMWVFWSLMQERSNKKAVLFTIIFAFTILVKETAVLLSPVFIAFILWRRFAFKKAISWIDLCCVSVFPFLIAGLAYIYLGGFPNVIETIRIIINSPKTNPYPIAFCQGPWYRYIIDYMLLSPWVAILSIAFVFCSILSRETQEIYFYFLIVSALTLILFNFLAKNVRYVIMLDMPMRLFAAALLKDLVFKKFTRRRQAITLLAIIVLMISAYDYLNFKDLFLMRGIYDPVSHALLKAKHIIPY